MAEFPLPDWLNVGERMLLAEVSDVLALDIFRRLFDADSETTMEDAFAELVSLSESYAADTAKAKAELRRKRGITRRVSEDQLAQAMAEYGPQPSPPADGEGD